LTFFTKYNSQERLKKNKIAFVAKIWKPPRQHFDGLAEFCGQSAKDWQVFETGGHTYITLLVDRRITYTKPWKQGMGCTWAKFPLLTKQKQKFETTTGNYKAKTRKKNRIEAEGRLINYFVLFF